MSSLHHAARRLHQVAHLAVLGPMSLRIRRSLQTHGVVASRDKCASMVAGCNLGERLDRSHAFWALRHIGQWRDGCLPAALIAEALCETWGQPCALHLGLRRDASRGIVGHAWLEVDGHPVVGATSDSFEAQEASIESR